MKTFFRAPIFVLIIGLFLIISSPVYAQDKVLRTRISADTIQKGCNFSFNDGKFNLGVPPEVLDQHKKYKLSLKKVKWDKKFKKKKSPIYTYDIRSHNGVDLKQPLWLTIQVDPDDVVNRDIFLKYWDGNLKLWKKIPSSYDQASMTVRAAIHLPYAQVAVFTKKKKKVKYNYQKGMASWYRWHGAASNDYPMGTRLKVISLDNGQSVKVTVVSTGPFNSRIIDLPAEAFAKIADLDQGVARVKVRAL